MRYALIPLLCLAAAPARAANDSIATIAVGSHSVVAHAAGSVPAASSMNGYGQGVSARVRLLYILGAELSYDITSDRGIPVAQRNVCDPAFQLSGLLYVLPWSRFSLFLVAGTGGTNASDMFTLTGATTSYHAGAGLEIGITKHWIVSADFRVNLPAYNQVMSRMPAALAADHNTSLTTFYNVDTWQLAVGMRYYL